MEGQRGGQVTKQGDALSQKDWHSSNPVFVDAVGANQRGNQFGAAADPDVFPRLLSKTADKHFWRFRQEMDGRFIRERVVGKDKAVLLGIRPASGREVGNDLVIGAISE